MKKAMTILAGSFLGAMALIGGNQAEARGYKGRSKATRTVTKTRTVRNYRGTVKTRTRVTTRTRTTHRYRAPARTYKRHIPSRRAKRHFRNHRMNRFVLKKVYSLKPYIGRRAHRILNRRFAGNVQLFCLNQPGFCNVSYTKVWY